MWPPRSADAWTRRGLIGALAAAVAASASAKAKGRVHRIVIDKLAFEAPAGPLHVGDTIEWVNRDILQHTATARDGAFDLVLAPKGRGRVTLRRAGTVEVYCRYHPGMKIDLAVAA